MFSGCQLKGAACHTMSPRFTAASNVATSAAVGHWTGRVRLFIRVLAAQSAGPASPAGHPAPG